MHSLDWMHAWSYVHLDLLWATKAFTLYVSCFLFVFYMLIDIRTGLILPLLWQYILAMFFGHLLSGKRMLNTLAKSFVLLFRYFSIWTFNKRLAVSVAMGSFCDHCTFNSLSQVCLVVICTFLEMFRHATSGTVNCFSFCVLCFRCDFFLDSRRLWNLVHMQIYRWAAK